MVHHRTAIVEGLEVFYREAGDPAAPTLVLLHGFPSSSFMFRVLMPALAERLHLIAPDYPGSGNTQTPPPAESPEAEAPLIDAFISPAGIHANWTAGAPEPAAMSRTAGTWTAGS